MRLTVLPATQARLLPWLVALCLACSVEDGVLGGMRSQPISTPDAGGGSAGQVAACALTTPSIQLPLPNGSGSYTTCTGRLASASFTNALCVCGDVRAQDYLVTRGFDSTLGSYRAGQADDSGAAVAINGGYQTIAGYTDIGGSLSIAGESGATCVGYLSCRGDFRAAGDVTVAGYASIARNAWLAGDFLSVGPANIGGELHRSGSATALPLLASQEFVGPVQVGPACPCDASERLDTAALVEQSARSNDNARSGIDPMVLSAVSEARVLELPCGSFYLTRIAGAGPVTIRGSGLIALFVEENVDLASDLTIELATGAEVDVFVRGDLRVAGTIALSSTERPAAGRMFVGGSREIPLRGTVVGNFYAPNANVIVESGATIWGSIFAGSFSSRANVSFVYDRSVGATGRTCGEKSPPLGVCTRCGSCFGGTACVGGQCGACLTDDDCCSQNICANGSCAPLVSIQ